MKASARHEAATFAIAKRGDTKHRRERFSAYGGHEEVERVPDFVRVADDRDTGRKRRSSNARVARTVGAPQSGGENV